MDRPAARRGRGIDALPMLLCRLIGGRRKAAMGWRRYAVAMLAFNAALFCFAFALLWLQPCLPLNPDRKGPLSGDLIFNIVCSFVTNCSLQHYAGEQHLSYASQIGVIAFLDFVSTATWIGLSGRRSSGACGAKPISAISISICRGRWSCRADPPALVVSRALAGRQRRADDVARRRRRRRRSKVLPRRSRGAGGRAGADQAARHHRRRILRSRTRPTRSRTRRPGATWSRSSAIIVLPMAAIVAFGLMIKDKTPMPRLSSA